MTLKPGDRGLDYSGLRLTDAQAREAVKDGAKFVTRYSAGAASDPSHASHASVTWKMITPAEFKFLRSHGLDIVANDEWYESRCTEGAAAGAADGEAAARLWKSCGYAPGAAIYVSWDSAPVQSEWDNVDAYLRAYGAAAYKVGRYSVGCYAGTPYLAHALNTKVILFGWRPNAGSWSNDGLPYQPLLGRSKLRRLALARKGRKATPAHVYQTGNYWFNKGADENLILRAPIGSHVWAQTPPPEPPPVAPPASTTNIDAAKAALKKAQKQHKKPGPIRRMIDAALKALKVKR